eukprot:453757_1
MSETTDKKVDGVKIAVAMASHIRYNDQCELLCQAISSLANQELHCDILIGMSCDEKYKPDEPLESEEKIWPTHKYRLVVAETRLYQMEHFHNLSKYFGEYDLILFCDDDDEYQLNRTYQFADAFLQAKEILKADQEMGFIAEQGHDDEYWCYGVPPSIIDTFFDKMKDDTDLFKNTYSDMIFRQYLRSLELDPSKLCGRLNSEKPLYIHNTNNKNSITSISRRLCIMYKNKEERDYIIRQNAFLYAVTNVQRPINHLIESKVSLEEIENVFPEMEYVKVVMMFLCDHSSIQLYYLK